MDERKSVKLSKNMVKITITVLIVVAIGRIWYFKNSNKIPIVKNDNPSFALHVTDSLDIEKLKSYGIPIMIDFGAESCIPCKQMEPVLKQLNQELRGKAIIKFVDVGQYQKLAQGYPISVIPTQVFLNKEGKPYTPKDPEISKMQIYSSKDTKKHVFTTHEGGMSKEEILAIFKEMGVE
ncbi:thioredoxin family protein [Clostridium tagluense]|uniref:thioredoxin family protein n=1 Tax=Clostridium tagluense TaxID=360422 RepID=UPI001C6DFB2F|nr:thioredoxin family protein [Clostridium tagluense]MBW9155722.1 thioredoxin family protein [Clostridium tagluense]WLC65321.1 thioredoxin family protein [Clostridium tagluense]